MVDFARHCAAIRFKLFRLRLHRVLHRALQMTEVILWSMLACIAAIDTILTIQLSSSACNNIAEQFKGTKNVNRRIWLVLECQLVVWRTQERERGIENDRMFLSAIRRTIIWIKVTKLSIHFDTEQRPADVYLMHADQRNENAFTEDNQIYGAEHSRLCVCVSSISNARTISTWVHRRLCMAPLDGLWTWPSICG